MPAVLTSGKVQKRSTDKTRLPMDFGDIPQLISGASLDDDDNLVMSIGIASYNITCEPVTPGDDPVTVSALQEDYPYQISALFFGGQAGSLYNVIFIVVLDDPDGTQISRVGSLEIMT